MSAAVAEPSGRGRGREWETAELIEEIEDLLALGRRMTKERLAAHFGYTQPDSLSRRLRRAGRTDLWARFTCSCGEPIHPGGCAGDRKWRG